MDLSNSYRNKVALGAITSGLVLGAIAVMSPTFERRAQVEQAAQDAGSASENERSVAVGGNPAKFAQAAVDELPRGADWRSVTVKSDAKVNSYSVVLDYAPSFLPFVRPDAPETDAKAIARSILQRLVEAGLKPSENNTQVFVWVQQSGIQGETRGNMVSIFGYATYDAFSDSIKYKPYKPLFQ